MKLLKNTVYAAAFGMMLCAGNAAAETVTADVYETRLGGSGVILGTVTFTDTQDGLEIKTNLNGLKPGDHGFHVHENGDCTSTLKDGKIQAASAAGGHYDPDKTGKHLGPEANGHKGDLPVLYANADGDAITTMHVKGVKAADFKNRSIMIHRGGDNYSDEPSPLGGGGERFACGVIK